MSGKVLWENQLIIKKGGLSESVDYEKDSARKAFDHESGSVAESADNTEDGVQKSDGVGGSDGNEAFGVGELVGPEGSISKHSVTPKAKHNNGNTLRDSQEDQCSINITAALTYYHQRGVILHFSDSPILENYVFQDIDFIVDTFKALFHHNMKEMFDYTTNKAVQTGFRAQEFKMAMEQYEKEGLLSMKLIKVLWHHHNFNLKENDIKALVELMKVFDICYPLAPDEKVFYLPWFTEVTGSN